MGFKPIARWSAALGGQDLHLVAGFQAVVERDQLAIDLRAAAAVADFGMHRVGKIDRRGAHRQVDDIAAWGENVHAVFKDVCFDAVHEFLGVLDILAPFHELAQPIDALLVMIVLAAFFLIQPMGGNTIFRRVMHFFRADLHFQRFTVGIDTEV